VIAIGGMGPQLGDWMSNMNVELGAPSGGAWPSVRVNRGFDHTLDGLWSELLRVLEVSRVFERRLPIWLTGHGLGGALAVLAALRLEGIRRIRRDRGESMSDIGGVFTFGQPRVGDEACAHQLNTVFGDRYYRSVNSRDPVSRLPPVSTPALDSTGEIQVLSYQHAGRLLYFNGLGQGMIDPEAWYTALEDPTSPERYRNVVEPLAACHSISAYIDLHQSWLDA
jgi:triacylglycerol lipase